MDWFEQLTGFPETSYADTKARLHIRDGRLHTATNGRSFAIGRLELPSVGELRTANAALADRLPGRIRVRNVQADIRALHADPGNAGALFQVASQFNLLEMTSQHIPPEMGVTRYALDRTQGPACAISAGAATIFRNFFVPVGSGEGQTGHRQLDALADVGLALGNTQGRLWRMQNGYALCSMSGLDEIAQRLAEMPPNVKSVLRDRLRIGIHRDVEVTAAGPANHLVTQAFCSALPVSYANFPARRWEPFARLILEGAYEATFSAGLANAARTGNRTVFLTLLGGGAFGNERRWIIDALGRAIDLFADTALDIRIVSFGAILDDLSGLVR